jgi:hypothetical protein
MTDYYPLIAKAVSGLEKNTGDQRRALYERARMALIAQLRGLDPPVTESEITRERLALEESIRKVESEAARKARLEVPRIDPVTLTRPRDLPPRSDQGLKGFRDLVAEAESTSKQYSRGPVSDPLAELARLIGQDEAFKRAIEEGERQRAEEQRQREEQERQQAQAQQQQEEKARREREEALRRYREEAERQRAEAQRQREQQEQKEREEALRRQHEEAERQRAEAQRQREQQEQKEREEALRRQHEEAERQRAEAQRQREQQEQKEREEALRRQHEEAERQRAEAQRQRKKQERRKREEVLRLQREKHAKREQIGSPRGSPISGRIFINYRRSDDPGTTGRLFDRLRQAFQPDQLFFDVDDIAPGLDFVKVLEEQISRCDIVLAVIGRNWINALDEAGARRLENPKDFVRIEIESAFTQGKLVIPVLVHEARMPREEELPDPLKPLIQRHAVRLTHERFHADMQGLIKWLQKALDDADALRRAQAEAARRADKKEKRRRAREAAREQQ